MDDAEDGEPGAGDAAPWPDFFIVGAPRSGTTAMATYLDGHPDVFCLASGPHYYERDQDPDVETTVHDREAYRRLFADAGDAQRVGEKSVWYLRDPWAPKAIRRDVPEADVLVMLRDPVEMVPSLHARRLERGDEHIPDLGEALEAEPHRRAGERVAGNVEAPGTLLYTEVARYARQVRRWLDAFGRDQVHVVLFEDFVDRTGEVYDETLRFLGVEPGHRPGFERVRPRRRVRSLRLHRLLWNPPEPLARTARALLPQDLRSRAVAALRERNLDDRADRDLDPAIRRRLREAFRDDVRELEGLLERDLSGWLASGGDDGGGDGRRGTDRRESGDDGDAAGEARRLGPLP